MDLSVVIVSYNTRELLLQCIASIDRSRAKTNLEIIVIDNDSTDGSADAIEAEYPGVNLIRSGQNLGFARANNAAMQHARGKWVLLLNPDTALIDDALPNLLSFANAHPQAGIFGGRTYFGDGSLNFNSCHGLPTLWSQLLSTTGLSRMFRRSALLNPEGLGSWPRDTARIVPAITGCFMLLRRSLWETLGGFDTDYFMYLEETDLCARARKIGVRCMICPDARLYHYEGQSDKILADKLLNLLRSRRRYARKHFSPSVARLADRLITLWIFNRMILLQARQWVSGKSDPQLDTIRKVWRLRNDPHAALPKYSAVRAPSPQTIAA